MSYTIEEIERQDGIRLTWNVWPTSPSRMECVPIACLYNIHQPCPVLPYEPIVCSKCRGVISPQVVLDFRSSSWRCLYCDANNVLPGYTRDITPDNLLPELVPSNSTVEYLLSKSAPFPPVFLFLVDCSTYDEERHELLKRTVHQALDKIPEDAFIGIIRYGTNIELLGFSDEKILTIFEFSGKVEYTEKDIANLRVGDMRHFLGTKKETVVRIKQFIDETERDPFPVMNGFRQMRCTGSALSLAVSFFEESFSDSPVKYLLFTQGPCTFGPGKVCKLEISGDSFEDVDPVGAAILYKKVGERMNKAGHSLDIIAETISDIGIEQMKHATVMTGGFIVFGQDFEEKIISGSLDRLFVGLQEEQAANKNEEQAANRNEERTANETGVLAQGYNVTIQVHVSGNLIFKGFIGEGQASGDMWRVGCIHPSSNLTLVFENAVGVCNESVGHVQIVSKYQRSDKKIMTRVTSFSRMFSSNKWDVCATFDQEAACVFQARALLSKGYKNVMDFESGIDKNLIKFLRRYSTFTKGDPNSVVLPKSMDYYPNFMYFFRRSLLVQRDGISDDESAYYRQLMSKIPTSDALKMIKPSLVAFHYQGDIYPVELDTSSLSPEFILVLDSFHNVLLWRGPSVAEWIKEGLHEKEEYAFFKQSINDAESYSDSLMVRLPTPQFKETDYGCSQERILLHYVNPSQHGTVITERINYEFFFKTLCKFIVRSE